MTTPAKQTLRNILIAVLLSFVTCGDSFALHERDCEECLDYKYGQVVTSNIGRTGKVIKCGSIFPNPMYGYGIEIRWDDDPNGKSGFRSIESKK